MSWLVLFNLILLILRFPLDLLHFFDLCLLLFLEFLERLEAWRLILHLAFNDHFAFGCLLASSRCLVLADNLIDSLVRFFVEVNMIVYHLLQLLLLLFAFLLLTRIVHLFEVIHSLVFSHLRTLQLSVLCELEVLWHFLLLLFLHLLVLGAFSELEVPLLFLPALLQCLLCLELRGEDSVRRLRRVHFAERRELLSIALFLQDFAGGNPCDGPLAFFDSCIRITPVTCWEVTGLHSLLLDLLHSCGLPELHLFIAVTVASESHF